MNVLKEDIIRQLKSKLDETQQTYNELLGEHQKVLFICF